MPKNWKTYKLGEVSTLQRGFDLPNRKRVHGGYPVIAASGFSTWHNEYKVKGPGVTTGRSGTLGQVFYEENNFWPLNTSLWVKDFHGNDPKFIYYFLQTLNFAEFNSGTSVPTLNRNDVHSLDVQIPDIKEQKAIANILSAIDDKIKNNLAINKTLEDMAMALYKHWFVDFEFPLSQETHPELVEGSHNSSSNTQKSEKPLGYKSAGGEFIDSELGPIPKGWEVKSISEVFEVRDGTHDSPKRKEEGCFLITSKHLKGNQIDYSSAYKISKEDFDKVNNRSLVEKGDILMTMIGTVGNFFFVNHEPDYAIKNIGLFKTSQTPKLQYYVYSFFKSKICQDYIKAQMSGSTQQYITLKTLRSFPIIFPSLQVIEEYTNFVKNNFEKIDGNIKENQSLTQLRDTLLPKLISGEVRLKEFRKQVETVL